MDRLPTRWRRWLPCLMLATQCTGGALGATTADEAVTQNAAAIAHVSGGVGTESADRLNAIAANFNLKLVFALTSGDYLSGVKVDIVSAAGQPLVTATADGPWFLVKLPAGKYQVVATFDGRAMTRQIAVEGSTLQTVDFRWNSQ